MGPSLWARTLVLATFCLVLFLVPLLCKPISLGTASPGFTRSNIFDYVFINACFVLRSSSFRLTICILEFIMNFEALFYLLSSSVMFRRLCISTDLFKLSLCLRDLSVSFSGWVESNFIWLWLNFSSTLDLKEPWKIFLPCPCWLLISMSQGAVFGSYGSLFYWTNFLEDEGRGLLLLYSVPKGVFEFFLVYYLAPLDCIKTRPFSRSPPKRLVIACGVTYLPLLTDDVLVTY